MEKEIEKVGWGWMEGDKSKSKIYEMDVKVAQSRGSESDSTIGLSSRGAASCVSGGDEHLEKLARNLLVQFELANAVE